MAVAALPIPAPPRRVLIPEVVPSLGLAARRGGGSFREAAWYLLARYDDPGPELATMGVFLDVYG